MSSIITTAREFRADVLRNDRAMLTQLSGAYETIARSLKSQLSSLMRDIGDAQKAGKTVNPEWLRRSFQYQQLINQVKGQISGYANGVNQFIQAKQRQAINLGQFQASELIQVAAPEISFARLPSEAINELVGTLADGSPLSKVLDRLGPQAAKEIKDALLSGIGSGWSPAKIGSEIRKTVDVPRWKALQIARTETLRAFRQSTLATYAENSDVLDGWVWLSTLSTRTCAACWALNGEFFPLSKTFFPAHVSCRCTSIPKVKGSGFSIPSGVEAFAELPVIDQQEILGPSRYEMYASGTSLWDFVILTRDKEWGGAYQVRPLWKMKSGRKAA